jgi:hypothetical protein
MWIKISKHFTPYETPAGSLISKSNHNLITVNEKPICINLNFNIPIKLETTHRTSTFKHCNKKVMPDTVRFEEDKKKMKSKISMGKLGKIKTTPDLH